MMSGEGTHFLSSHNRRPSRRDSAIHIGDRNVDPYGVLGEKGSTDDRTGKGEQYEYELPTVDDRRSITGSKPSRKTSSAADTAQSDTKRGQAPPLRSSRDRSLGTHNEPREAIAAAASALSGKPVTKRRREKPATKEPSQEDAGARRKDSGVAEAPPEYGGDEKTEFVETKTYLEPSGDIRETVESGPVVQGQPISQETEMRSTEQPQLGKEEEPAEEEAVDIPVRKGQFQEPEPTQEREMGAESLRPAEGVEEMPEDEWDKFEEEEYIEEEWETEERGGLEEQLAGKEDMAPPPAPVPAQAERAIPTAMAPQASTYAAVASAPAPEEVSITNAEEEKTNATTNAAVVTPIPTMAASQPVTASPTTVDRPTVNPLGMNAATTNADRRRPQLITIPGTPWPLYEEPTEPPPPPRKEPAQDEALSKQTTVCGTPWPVKDAEDMVRSKKQATDKTATKEATAVPAAAAAAAAPAVAPKKEAAKEEKPKKKVDKAEKMDKVAADKTKAPTRLPGGQDPAGPEVRPGPGPPVRTTATARPTKRQGTPERMLSRAEKKMRDKADRLIQKQKIKDDKLRETEVKRQNNLALVKDKDEVKRQKEAEKRHEKETKEREKEAKKNKQQNKDMDKQQKQDAKKNKREAKERAKQVEQEAKQRKKEAKKAKKQGGTQ